MVLVIQIHNIGVRWRQELYCDHCIDTGLSFIDIFGHHDMTLVVELAFASVPAI